MTTAAVKPLRPAAVAPSRQTFIREPRFDRPLHPLTTSTWLPRHAAAVGAVMRRFGLPVDGLDERVIDGRVYGRVVPMLDRGADGSPPPAWLLRLLLRTVPAMRRRLAAADGYDGTAPIEAILDRWDATGRDTTERRTRELRSQDLAAMPDRQLADHLDAVLGHVESVADDHFELSFAGVLVPTGRLGLFVEQRLGWRAYDIITLVAGYGDASTEHGRALDGLAAGLGADGVERAIADPASAAEHPAMRTYLQAHGHRFNVDLSAPTEAEDLRQVAGHLRRWRDRSGSWGDPRTDAEQAAAQARADLLTADRETFDELLRIARRGRPYGDETELATLDALTLVRLVALEASRRWRRDGMLHEPDDIWFLTQPELVAVLRGAEVDRPALHRRRREHAWALAHQAPDVIGPPPAPPPPIEAIPARYQSTVGAILWSVANGESSPEVAAARPDDALQGVPASPGRVRGTVRVIRDESEFERVQTGDILVCPTTVAAWSPIFAMISGLVTEHGGLLSHPAILAREYGLPAVLSVPDATRRLVDSGEVELDGSAGVVTPIGS